MINELSPIYINTKGRYNCSTARLLKESGLKPILVVENCEASLYKANFPDLPLLILPENNRGLSYSRNCALKDATDKNYSWVWFLDDDITRFHVIKDKKTLRISAKQALLNSQNYFINRKDIAIAGLEYKQFFWSQDKDFKLFSYTDVCVCVNVNAVKGLFYKESLKLKLDRDFSLQVLARGYKTLKVIKFAFASPKNGSNIGGLKSTYETKDLEYQECVNMVRIWGEDVCKLITKKDGRKDLKIDWQYFHKKVK